MGSTEAFLAYHCPKLRSEHLRSPCELNLGKAKELRKKFPHALLGPLEHCAACKGKNLVVREAPVSHLGGETELVTAGPGAAIAPQIEEKVNISEMPVPLGQKEESMPQVQVQAPEHMPEAVRGLIKGQFCKNHPEVESKQDKNGHYMGRCVACLAAVAARNSRNRGAKGDKEKMTPAVARDLGKGQTKPLTPEAIARGREAVGRLKDSYLKSAELPRSEIPPTGDDMTRGAVAFKNEAEAEKVLGPGKLPGRPLYAESPDATCKKHPERPAKIDSLGRNMRLCQECVSERGRKAGKENSSQGLTSPPVSIPLNQAKWAEVKAWLEEQAEEYNRTLTEEIMYRLRLAMREASLVG